jgi:hypothetical protein
MLASYRITAARIRADLALRDQKAAAELPPTHFSQRRKTQHLAIFERHFSS